MHDLNFNLAEYAKDRGIKNTFRESVH